VETLSSLASRYVRPPVDSCGASLGANVPLEMDRDETAGSSVSPEVYGKALVGRRGSGGGPRESRCLVHEGLLSES
ncbi:hypothetical protein V1478_002094, partial [Vespula squamosa]